MIFKYIYLLFRKGHVCYKESNKLSDCAIKHLTVQLSHMTRISEAHRLNRGPLLLTPIPTANFRLYLI